MNKNNKCKYIPLFVLLTYILYTMGVGAYIIFLITSNSKLHDNAKCLDIDVSNGMILEKDNNIWNDRYNIIKPINGYTELKCPTSYPVIYHMFNESLVGYMIADNIIMNTNISIIDCKNTITYIMSIGIFIINTNIVSVDIKQNNQTIYYIKHNIYKTNNIDLYNIQDVIVANLKYTNNLWNISIYNHKNLVDYNILLSLINYHQYYINGFTTDMCNQYVYVSYMLIFCALIILCCICIVFIRYLFIFREVKLYTYKNLNDKHNQKCINYEYNIESDILD